MGGPAQVCRPRIRSCAVRAAYAPGHTLQGPPPPFRYPAVLTRRAPSDGLALSAFSNARFFLQVC